jgi:hypothetical protein
MRSGEIDLSIPPLKCVSKIWDTVTIPHQISFVWEELMDLGVSSNQRKMPVFRTIFEFDEIL